VIVTKLDRLGRSMRELLGLIERIVAADAAFNWLGIRYDLIARAAALDLAGGHCGV